MNSTRLSGVIFYRGFSLEKIRLDREHPVFDRHCSPALTSAQASKSCPHARAYSQGHLRAARVSVVNQYRTIYIYIYIYIYIWLQCRVPDPVAVLALQCSRQECATCSTIRTGHCRKVGCHAKNNISVEAKASTTRNAASCKDRAPSRS